MKQTQRQEKISHIAEIFVNIRMLLSNKVSNHFSLAKNP
jgi:hypothetical protein